MNAYAATLFGPEYPRVVESAKPSNSLVSQSIHR